MRLQEWDRLSSDHQEILERHLSKYPVKVGQIAKDLNVSVKVSRLPKGISGQIKREGDSYVIRVSRFEARERQRFTIAHEIAHFLLHKSIIDGSNEGITDNVLYRSGAPKNTEFEANRLAAEIVMPAHLIERTLREDFNETITEETIEDLAERFLVSKSAMEICLSNF